MILWINGAFGAGKTHTAYALHRRFPGSFVFDPENMGFYLRENLPASMVTPDFQDIPLWRQLNGEILAKIADTCEGDILVPMTVTNGEYFTEITALARKRHRIEHCLLQCSEETVRRRLRSRFEGKHSWAAAQISRCLEAFSHLSDCHKINTDALSVEEAAEAVAASVGIALLPDTRGPIQRFTDRISITWRHVR